MPRVLKKDEELLASLLSAAGVVRGAARCLVCLARGGQWSTTDLGEAAGLSAAGVSQAMQVLVSGGLASRALVRSGGKGRPSHLYEVAGPAGDILRNVERQRREALLEELAQLDELKAAIKRVA